MLMFNSSVTCRLLQKNDHVGIDGEPDQTARLTFPADAVHGGDEIPEC
jgi:hypothetical protein